MVLLNEKLCISSIRAALVKKGIDDYTLFRYYVKGFTAVGKPFKSRNEKNPSSNTKLAKDGSILFTDFGDGGECKNIFQYIMQSEGFPDNKKGFLAALDKIRQDFSLEGIESYNGELNPHKSNKTPVIFERINLSSVGDKKIEIKKRLVNDEDLYFWNKYTYNSTITQKDLSFYRIYPISHYWINGWMFSCERLSYAYLIGGKIKLYFPYESDWRFIGNTNKDSIQGYEQLPKRGKKIIITKSLKDVVVLKKELNIPAIAPNSETLFISKDKVNELKERFDSILIYYDNDYQGIDSSIKFSKEFNIDYFINPLECPFKDYSDVIKSNNVSLIKQINRFLC